MGQLSYADMPTWVINRMLSFLNRANHFSDITSLISDNHYSGKQGEGYGIGETVAQRILDRRKELNPRYFNEISQLHNIEGLGQDKLDDLAYTFRLSSAEQFVQNMFNDLLVNNWELEHVSKEYSSFEEFARVTKDPDLLREEVGVLLNQVAALKFGGSPLSGLANRLLEGTYLDVYEIANQAQYAWALWFYRFDNDNWFGFDKVRKIILTYLEEYWNPDDYTGFALFRGYDGEEVWGSGVLDLPVTFSAAELKLTIWRADLHD